MNDAQDINMDPASLYREEVFTDQKIGTIRRMTPVTPTGEVDDSRPVEYLGATQAMSPMGPIPINFELEADSIGEAAEKFAAAAEAALERTAKELEELRRQQASSIVVPGQQGGGLSGGGMPGGGSGIITP